ncbi:Co2+/Mg2+ efflux protein ApaG [Aliidiomarina sedimenti]|uniref:Protein ApaG n=2 Tax=Aliidiomarina TaxID=1249554 RepID=A0A432WDV1_9GAMM|nr:MULTISPECIES: Co2+/Mg2+ efflux protein ApaG [Aliidiomarina]RUO27951.1 Co2+/Mg2+ efflux protein ApaG [Aliidiomarina sedimenti]RUO31042.1 Co2+/Mg2+ efflux protein ApaG [Aliidiomarina soli]
MLSSNVLVNVETRYLQSQSDPEQKQFVFSYTITITNDGSEAIQLLTREWTINDADGKVTQVAGDGVVGKQPVIQPGEAFSYTSGTVLTTPIGSMHGHYGICDQQGELHQVAIPAFRLAVPHILH